MATFVITTPGLPAAIFIYLKEQKQEEAIQLIRISIFERAFLMYQRAPSKSKQDQWEGWPEEIKEWLERKNFKAIWAEHSLYFDKTFVEYFSDNIKN